MISAVTQHAWGVWDWLGPLLAVVVVCAIFAAVGIGALLTWLDCRRRRSEVIESEGSREEAMT